MKCKQIQDMMGAYLYGDLSPDEMREVRQHTQVCDACRVDVESRGRVIASLDDTAPELSDEERMRIAWGVKGAVRSAAAVRTGLRFTRGSAVALAGVLLAGMAVAAMVVVNSGKPPFAGQQARDSKASATVVEITEEPGAPPKNDSLGTQGQAANTGTESTVDRLAAEARRALPLGVSRQERERKSKIVPDKPATILNKPKDVEPKVEQPTIEEPRVAPAQEGQKLPEPTNANDARTAE